MNFKGEVFVVLTGDCTVDEDGCVSSPGYDSGAYGNNERCRIAVNAAVATPLRVENFSTEAWCWGFGVSHSWLFGSEEIGQLSPMTFS